MFENWKKYKYSVPVYGAILLNQNLDKVNMNCGDAQIHYRRYYHSVLIVLSCVRNKCLTEPYEVMEE